MRAIVAALVLAVAAASVVKDDYKDFIITKEPMINLDVKTKEVCILKLLNHILQPTMYDDIRDIAREFVLEDNMDKFLKAEVIKDFISLYKLGMLPRGEIFVNTDEKQLKEAIAVFRILYFAKDFDTFIKTACWLRERINNGMFVYCLNVAVVHRVDCNGIVLPAPYEVYPFLFVDSHIIKKVHMLKMTKGWLDPILKDYYGIVIKDNNLVIVDWRKGVRHTLTKDDRLTYFTEDIDLSTYLYNMHLMYPTWMIDDIYNVNKERRGEVMAYMNFQLLARYRLERLGWMMCDVKPLLFDKCIKKGVWPKIMLHTGDEMPVRMNNVDIMTDENAKIKLMIDDIDMMIRHAIMTGHITLRDGTVLTLRKAEDFETLARLVLGSTGLKNDDAKIANLVTLFRKMLGYGLYNINKYTYVPTALDMYRTCLRDPVYWKLMKRITDYFVTYKRLLPKYTREELSFPGIKVEHIETDKLVTFMDEFDLDITNSVYLDQSEMQKRRSDMVYVARMRRLNHHPFKVSIDVVSDKATDAVVRVFLGPKYDCMGRLLDINDKRLDMVEIDSFVHKLDTGKNTIVRNSVEMHGIIEQRPWTRTMWHRASDMSGTGVTNIDSWWYKSRIGFPHRLLLPLGRAGGFDLQLFVIVTPVRMGLVLPTVDLDTMKMRKICPWTTCVDTMPLGFPFDRPIDERVFYNTNVKFLDVKIFRKDLVNTNVAKDIDLSEMIMRRDDLTFLDKDMLMRRSYRDVMLMSVDNMSHL
uniref:Hexamerin storage protein PinSP2 n=1 Tax=Plodia interpunctella TaxID=58824 RepID=Q963S9_PLOIN|nr:hexamerin storage protein PinSP2 [Plodia interpunctella]